MLLILILVGLSTTVLSVQSAAGNLTCYGYVKSSTGVALNYAKVEIIYEDIELGDIYVSTMTNSDGYYSINVATPPSVYCAIIASRSGYYSQTKSVYSPSISRVDFSLSAKITCLCSGNVYNDDTSFTLQGATVKLYSSTSTLLASTTTNSLGAFSLSGTTPATGNFKLTISKSGFETLTSYYSAGSHYNIVKHLMPSDTSSEKLAFFFYNSELNFVNCVQRFGATILLEGFSVTLYENPTDWFSKLEYIDTIEGASDFIFLYFYGHGNNYNDNSYVTIAPEAYIYSTILDSYVDKFESTNIFIVVESCHSGGFVANLQDENRFIISSTDLLHNSAGHVLIGPFFSTYFFDGILRGYIDILVFTYALNLILVNPICILIGQIPQFNDQSSYIWFLWPL